MFFGQVCLFAKLLIYEPTKFKKLTPQIRSHMYLIIYDLRLSFWRFSSFVVLFIASFILVEDCERHDGSPQKPYYMSKKLMKLLSKKNKSAENES